MINSLRFILLVLLLTLLALPAAAQITEITIGEEVSETRDTQVQYALALQAGEPVQIVARSEDFDIVLEVFDPDGVLVSEDDDSASTLLEDQPDIDVDPDDAGLIYNPVADGRYTVRVRAVGSLAPAGTYALTVTPVLIDDPYEYGIILPGEHLIPPRSVSTVTTTFVALRNEVVTLRAKSLTQDLVLLLYDSGDNLVAIDDDSGLRLNPAILYQPLPQDGVYTLVIRSYQNDLLTDPIALSYELSAERRLDEGSQRIALNLENPVERMVLTVTEGQSYTVSLRLSRETTAALNVQITEAGQRLPVIDVSVSGTTEAGFIYTATHSGTSEIVITYQVFLDDTLGVTINALPTP